MKVSLLVILVLTAYFCVLIQCIPKSMTDITIFRKVKIYHLLIYGDMEFHLMKMTFLLKAFPNIQEFYLKVSDVEIKVLFWLLLPCFFTFHFYFTLYICFL